MRRRLQELEGGVPDQRIPYDRTDPMVDVQAGGPQAAPPAFEGAPGGGPAMGGPSPGPGLAGFDLGALGAPPEEAGGVGAGLDTDQLTGEDLAALSGEGLDGLTPEELEVQQMSMALEDPNTPPEEKAQIEQLLAMAARRRIAGIGAGGGAPPLGGLGA